jgi:hypothetical protein
MTKIGTPNPEPKPEYIYHWDRIIGALVALVLVIGLIGYGVYSWLTPAAPPTIAEVEQAPTRDETSEGVGPGPGETLAETEAEADPLVDAPAETGASIGEGQMPLSSDGKVRIAGAAERAASGALVSEQGLAPTEDDLTRSLLRPDGPVVVPPSQPVEATSPTTPDRPGTAPPPPALGAEQTSAQTPANGPSAESDSGYSPGQENPLITDGELPIASDPNAAESRGSEPLPDPESPAESSPSETVVSSPSLTTEPAPDGEARQAIVPQIEAQGSSDDLNRSPNKAIVSPAVKRFSLARAVVDREPRGGLDDITVNADGSASVSSFSEVIGLQGEVLHYVWIHEGKEVLRIRVPVGANRWRSHSTKRIYRGMDGPWRAELRDSKGALLAGIDFVF